jgi:flagellar hook-length control protein FliK
MAQPNFLAAMLTNVSASAHFKAIDPGISTDVPSEGEVDLSLEALSPRSDARAEVQRQSLPQAANANASARFQPHTVQTLAGRIAARAVDGGRVFDIRLDPAELGRVEVRLEMGSDNSVRALLSAERADTLAELQRSARDLEKALADAGLDLAEDGLSFSLSDDGAPQRDENGEPLISCPTGCDREAFPTETPGVTSSMRLYGFELAARRGLDLRT